MSMPIRASRSDVNWARSEASSALAASVFASTLISGSDACACATDARRRAPNDPSVSRRTCPGFALIRSISSRTRRSSARARAVSDRIVMLGCAAPRRVSSASIASISARASSAAISTPMRLDDKASIRARSACRSLSASEVFAPIVMSGRLLNAASILAFADLANAPPAWAPSRPACCVARRPPLRTESGRAREICWPIAEPI